jgi:hypothetical protein
VIPPLVLKGDPSFDRPLVIDGIVLSIMPREMTATPRPISDFLDMLDGGGREFQRRPHFDGVADHSDRWTFSFPYGNLKGENLIKMDLIRVSGGVHRIVMWRMLPVIWTCKSGVQRYYLPRFRKIAAHVYEGLDIGNGYFVNTELIPTIATLTRLDLSETELAVTYAEGPALVDPGADGLVIARQPDTSGAAMDYTALLLGDDVDTGDKLTLWSCCAFDCSLLDPSIRMVGPTESHAYTFVEV